MSLKAFLALWWLGVLSVLDKMGIDELSEDYHRNLPVILSVIISIGIIAICWNQWQ